FGVGAFGLFFFFVVGDFGDCGFFIVFGGVLLNFVFFLFYYKFVCLFICGGVVFLRQGARRGGSNCRLNYRFSLTR
ncbi:hypothetical protein ACVGXS_05290, partial [Enterobacter hormaechei]